MDNIRQLFQQLQCWHLIFATSLLCTHRAANTVKWAYSHRAHASCQGEWVQSSGIRRAHNGHENWKINSVLGYPSHAQEINKYAILFLFGFLPHNGVIVWKSAWRDNANINKMVSTYILLEWLTIIWRCNLLADWKYNNCLCAMFPAHLQGVIIQCNRRKGIKFVEKNHSINVWIVVYSSQIFRDSLLYLTAARYLLTL